MFNRTTIRERVWTKSLIVAGVLATTGCGPLHGGGASTAAATSTDSPTPTASYLATVPDSVFAGMGYRFTVPTANEAQTVQVTQAKAEQIALAAAPFPTKVNSVALEHVTNPRTNAPPNDGHLTWVIDISPPGGAAAPLNAPGSAGPVKYWIAWVDASTGQELGFAFHD